MPERGRVISGSARGIRLEAPARGTRPLSDRVKQSLFAALDAGGMLEGRFLDLFAGTGAAGIEALSRGASGATFVESDGSALRVVGANLKRTGLTGEVVRLDVQRFLRRGNAEGSRPFSAALVDPPYDEPLVAPTLALLGDEALGWLEPGATVVAKHFWRDDAPEAIGSLRRERQKRFGETVLSFYTRS